jgi:hypothetical protein
MKYLPLLLCLFLTACTIPICERGLGSWVMLVPGEAPRQVEVFQASGDFVVTSPDVLGRFDPITGEGVLRVGWKSWKVRVVEGNCSVGVCGCLCAEIKRMFIVWEYLDG